MKNAAGPAGAVYIACNFTLETDVNQCTLYLTVLIVFLPCQKVRKV